MRRFQQKLIIPTASRPLIERSDLTDRLERSISTMRIVALAAPAGWGKTSALVQWSAATQLPIAWYTLDSADGDPSLFLDYLLHTIADYVPGARDIIVRLGSATAAELPQLCHTTALAIASAPLPFALVLDDFHLLSDSASASGLPLIQSLLSSIAEYAPDCHLVVASRTPPALYGMVRLIAQQRAAVLDFTALQFSPSDVQRLANASTGRLISDTSAARLTDQLGGWVTGIVLTLDRSITRRGDPGIDVSIARSEADQQPLEADTTQVYAFLAEQVIAPLPVSVQAFLEATSVLDYLSPRRCDTLREASDSAALLDHVRQYGLFTTSRAGWLAYHSLLRDFLRTRLARDPLREQRFLLRAATIYAEEENIEAAIDCYLAARAYDQALVLLREVAPKLRQQSRQGTLLACFDRLATTISGPLPPDVLITQAKVYSDLVLWERAYLAIQLAEVIGTGELALEAQIVHADFLRIQGNPQAARELLAGVPLEDLPHRLRMFYHMRAGQIHVMEGKLEAAIEQLELAHAVTMNSELNRDPNNLADIYENLGWAYGVQGQRASALRQLQRADACWQSIGNNGRRAMTLNNIGVLQLEERQYNEARTSLETGLSIARSTGRRREETTLLCSIADLDLLEGLIAEALQHFTEAYVIAERADLFDLTEYAAAGASWMVVLTDDANATNYWLQLTQPLVCNDALSRGRLILARLHYHVKQRQIDMVLLAELIEQATQEAAALGTAEQAYLQLARATLCYLQAGWQAAAEDWLRFEASATPLPVSLLSGFALAHDMLLAAAAPHAPLARRWLRAAGLTATRRWQISALGGFACRIDRKPCDLSPLHRTLLTRLLDGGMQGVAVDRLWESVWGDADLSMTALHQAMRRLRLQTGLSTAVRDGTCAIWGDWDEIEYDVRRLEQILEYALTRESAEQALALYRGDFLPSAPDGALYWVETRRTHLRERLLDALERYAGASEADHPQSAIQLYQRILQIDGCREQTAVHLMQLAARFGNRTLVATTFEHLIGALRVLGVTPGPATSALYRQLH
jgi:ATP/maltotriose-dependent transcriptional regulator MalT